MTSSSKDKKTRTTLSDTDIVSDRAETRRTFLKRAGVTGLAAAGVGSLAQCIPVEMSSGGISSGADAAGRGNDSDPNDPAGRGTDSDTGGTSSSADPAGRGSDSDPNDPVGRGSDTD